MSKSENIPTWALPKIGALLTGGATAFMMKTRGEGITKEYIISILIGASIGGFIGLILALGETYNKRKSAKEHEKLADDYAHFKKQKKK